MRSASRRLFVALVICLAAASARGTGFDWSPFERESVIYVLTQDEDGARRDTKVWVVVVNGSGYVRTNASTWLENIQRNPEIELQVAGHDYLMRAEEVKDAAVKEQVEEAYKEKYGFVQRVMSTFRFREPTVLRLVPRTASAAPPAAPASSGLRSPHGSALWRRGRFASLH
jgi:hypothetical protein